MRDARRSCAVLLVACVGFGCGVNPSDIVGASTKGSRSPIAIERPPDQAIRDRLSGILRQIEGLEDVRVDVQDGVVWLQGTTKTAALEQRATAIAMRLEDVVYVNDEIGQPSGLSGTVASVGRTVERIGRGAYELIPRLGSALVAFLPFALLAYLLGRWRWPRRVFGAGALRGGILRAALRWGVLWLGLVLALELLGVVGILWAVFGAFGLLGILAGFVFKDWVAAYLPGMSLGLHPPFHAGDLIHLGAHEGRVVRISPRATVLMTTDGEEVRIPNAVSLREPLINHSRQSERRLRFVVSLAPRADLGSAQEVGCGALLALRGVMHEPPPFMRTRALEREAIEVEFFAWVDQHEVNFRAVESTAKRVVFESFAEHGVPMAERTVTVRSAPAPEVSRAGPASVASTVVAEERDRAFLDEQLARARATRDERNLLDDSHAADSAARRNGSN